MTAARTDWAIVWLAIGAGVVGACQAGKMPVAIPVLRADLGLDLVEAGIAVSMLNMVSAAIGMAIGAGADLAGHRRAAAGGLALVALASAAGAFSTGAAGLLASRAAESFGCGFVFVAAPGIIFRATAERDRRLVFGIWGGYMPAGVSAMILLTPLLIGPLGWRGFWLFNAALLLAFALLFLAGTRRLPDRPPPPDRLAQFGRDMRIVLGARGPWLLALSFAFYAGSYLSMSAFLPSFLIERAGLAATTAAIATAIVVFGNVLGNVTGGWLLQRGWPRALLIGFAAGAMGATALLVFADAVPTTLRVAAAFAFSYFGGMLPASVLGASPIYAPTPAQLGTVNGMVLQGANVGQAVGPPIFAAVASGPGWAAAPLLCAAFGAIGVALALLIARYEARRGLRRR